MTSTEETDIARLTRERDEAKAEGHDRIAELESLLRECNAVCLCGCPASEHESYGEDGESCADEGHECIRVAPAVLEIVQRYRVALAGTPAPRPAQDAVREAAERADKAMRDVFGGVDQFGDYCGHPVMPGKLAYAVQALLAALPWEPAPGVREAFVAGGGAVVSGEAPGGEGKTCPGCGGLGWIPAGDEQAGCIDCNGTGHAPAPPSPAVAEGPLPEVPPAATEADALIRLAYLLAALRGGQKGGE